MNPHIFLGGSCSPTTWRADIAIPMLKEAGVNYYNPQVDDWYPELVEIEARAKAAADELLFVIDSQTRAIASILEATEVICTGRTVRLVIDDIEDGTVIDGQSVTGRELKDLNRAREYLRDLAARYCWRTQSVTAYDSVADAVSASIASARRLTP